MTTKKLVLLISALALVIVATVTVVLVVAFTREGVAVNSGTFTGSPNNVANDSWNISVARANGSSRIDYTFTAANLSAMHVTSTNSSGSITLTATQGDIERTFDITGAFNDNIDMSGFEPGRVRLRLQFSNAENVEILINWAR